MLTGQMSARPPLTRMLIHAFLLRPKGDTRRQGRCLYDGVELAELRLELALEGADAVSGGLGGGAQGAEGPGVAAWGAGSG